MSFNTLLGVGVRLAVIVLLFILLLRRVSNFDAVTEKLKEVFKREIDRTVTFPGPDTGTVIEEVDELILEQLSMKTHSVVHRYVIKHIPQEGISISRPNATSGTILLDAACDEAYGVSACHLLIGKDQKGIFARDNHSRGHTYINGQDTPIDCVAITDGLILMLNRQPIRFRIPRRPARVWYPDSPRNAAEEASGRTPLRR